MPDNKKKKTVKTIRINADKCNGCRVCEMICSSVHANPKHSSCNPARARIRVIRNLLTDRFIPVPAGEYTMAECAGRDKYTIGGKEYDECSFCRASCPSREEFKEPDSGLPLKCDLCEGEEEPQCVKWCLVDALTIEERIVQEEESDTPPEDKLETGLESLVDKYGIKDIQTVLARLAQKE